MEPLPAGEHDSPYRWIGSGLTEAVGEFRDQLLGEGIAVVRGIERERRDLLAHDGADQLGHDARISPVCSLTAASLAQDAPVPPEWRSSCDAPRVSG